MTFTIPANTAFIIVDVQKDFCPGGSLAVNEGDQIIPMINSLRAAFTTRVITQDFHPANHKSFASNHEGKMPFETVEMSYGTQILWPDHCIQETEGADFHEKLKCGDGDYLIQKGTHAEIDSYSGFFENDRRTQPKFPNGKTLAQTLRDRGITRVILCGLAYDFCVGWHALDARKEGFEALVLKDATRSIAMPLPGGGTTETAMDVELENAGVKVISVSQLPSFFPPNSLSLPLEEGPSL